MKKALGKILLASLMVAAVAGCARTAPVYNVENATVVTAGGQALSADQVKDAIIRAGNSLGWLMKDEGKGRISGKLLIRKHMAAIDITYSPKSYSIAYKDSEALDYDGANIHSNYNGWIQNLQQRIQLHLDSL